MRRAIDCCSMLLRNFIMHVALAISATKASLEKTKCVVQRMMADTCRCRHILQRLSLGCGSLCLFAFPTPVSPEPLSSAAFSSY